MVTQIDLSIRSARIEDRQRLANLIHFETLVHRHLDWRPPLEWFGHDPYLIAEQGETLVSLLICPPDPPNIAWIRLFAVSSDVNVKFAWQNLWTIAEKALAEGGVLTVAAIPLQQWFSSLLRESHFVHTDNVILLSWEGGHLAPAHKSPVAIVRPMNLDDIQTVEGLDSAAFHPVWRISIASLELAFRQAAYATVAETEDGVVGYQISTGNHLGGHLARLAVHPRGQGQGVGYTLLRDLLVQFDRRGARRITVNTQSDNLASLALYQKAGFQRTGESYPVYQYDMK